MADKRINALTTTSASVGDDYFAIDGATNGTRALSAFSPTFGGNATVTGTLTVNGATLTTAGDISVAADKGVYQKQGNVHKWTSDGTSTGTARADMYADSGGAFFIRTGGATQALTISSSQIATFASAVSISSTTASTTTSTGALVVGNGTSGGLGVGGAIVAGGTITSTASTDSGLLQLNLVNSSTGTSASSLFRFNAGTRTATLQAYNDTHATLAGQLRVGTSNGDIVVIPSGVTAATFGASAISLGALNYTNTITGGDTGAGTSIAQFRDGAGSTKINFKGNGEVVLSVSTASTSTSSGALVVSGGVGVAGAVFTGGYVHPGGDSGFYLRSTGSANGVVRANFFSTDVATAFLVRNDTGTTEYLRIESTGAILTIPATAPALSTNGTMTFERTSNTSLKISLRGTDGTTRSVSLTLT